MLKGNGIGRAELEVKVNVKVKGKQMKNVTGIH